MAARETRLATALRLQHLARPTAPNFQTSTAFILAQSVVRMVGWTRQSWVEILSSTIPLAAPLLQLCHANSRLTLLFPDSLMTR